MRILPSTAPWGSLLELLYPRACVECGAEAGAEFRYFCWDCASHMHVLQAPMCSLCGEPVEGRVDDEFVCHLCLDVGRHFDRARSAARFDGGLRTAVLAFKYNSGTWLAGDLAALMSSCFDTHFDASDVDLVVPVPLHPTRQRERGFNQASLLARDVARRLGKKCLTDAVARTRMTETQTHFTATQRASNVRNAFAAVRPTRYRGKRLLLIDDVMTTGSTVSEVSRVLKHAGAKSVIVLTAARG